MSVIFISQGAQITPNIMLVMRLSTYSDNNPYDSTAKQNLNHPLDVGYPKHSPVEHKN
jgi:hypothetical protein